MWELDRPLGLRGEVNNIDLCRTVQRTLEENLGSSINPNLRRSLHGLDLAHTRHGRDQRTSESDIGQESCKSCGLKGEASMDPTYSHTS